MRLLVPAAAAAALLALAGCSDPEPGSPLPTGAPAETSTSTAAPSPTATATPTDDAPTPEPGPAPTLPPEATTDDAAGAEAFVRYWFDTLEQAYTTLDTATLASHSTPDCEVCNAYIDEVEQLRALDRTVKGSQFVLTEVVAPAPDGTGATLVSTTLTVRPGRVLGPDGEVLETVEGETTSLGAILVREEDTWLMFGLGA
ncbi:DUF6318 family protein [uncultured Pseudokineococcus sp.]|uniref:DUF6318 family protein n=1 Tax=uncultured Pseudokineococcus sp. TaxID=1642928 RepID=UPI00262528EB|nr:DUF6318 family protein [uncultured Pseudokineococcus sp.]